MAGNGLRAALTARGLGL